VAFPGTKIPTSRIYGPGGTILNFLPAPNTTAGANAYNYTSQVPSAYPRRETILRGDYQIDSATRLSVRWVHNYDAQKFAYGTTPASWNWPVATRHGLFFGGERSIGAGGRIGSGHARKMEPILPKNMERRLPAEALCSFRTVATMRLISRSVSRSLNLTPRVVASLTAVNESARTACVN
jgi:hypothetical protein